ncbi:hypothetical protein MNBD_PLANCTO03-1685 [hydrothermal vent metagenome]|uniref:Ice-binding protein C-terminal domain-containing protein n=1 Tax=hydrothermal vent metagenome TaxID=652676 RepID=A0A3B1E0W2_9ZZZZ
MTDHSKSIWSINPSGQDCLVLAATIAAGSVAYADPVRFDNTSGFGWYYTTLDLTLSAEDQVYGGPGDVTGTSIYLDYFSDYYPAFSYTTSYTRGQGAEIWNSGWNNNYAAPFNSGDPIGPGMVDGSFHDGSVLEFAWWSYDYYSGEHDSGFRGLLPPDGSDTYMGIRLTIDNQLHYGWIGARNNGGYISVFAWGYETEAGVAIAAGVPAPSTLGLLAVGAVGALGRKRRA